jgi:hypothetical protein
MNPTSRLRLILRLQLQLERGQASPKAPWKSLLGLRFLGLSRLLALDDRFLSQFFGVIILERLKEPRLRLKVIHGILLTTILLQLNSVNHETLLVDLRLRLTRASCDLLKLIYRQYIMKQRENHRPKGGKKEGDLGGGKEISSPEA